MPITLYYFLLNEHTTHIKASRETNELMNEAMAVLEADDPEIVLRTALQYWLRNMSATNLSRRPLPGIDNLNVQSGRYGWRQVDGAGYTGRHHAICGTFNH
jgi:hypothetical protein